mmetsp:Transcript_70316/g.161317  ORF Transcript_70316/g.161317 Transcript_70316/m.161317 type:complete len:235 (+) Transcript_70316:1116-1820(+)
MLPGRKDPARLRPPGLAAAGPQLGGRAGGIPPPLHVVWLGALPFSGGRGLLFGCLAAPCSWPRSRDAHRGVSAFSPRLDMLPGLFPSLLPTALFAFFDPRGVPPPFRGAFPPSPTGSSNVPPAAADALRLAVFLGVLRPMPVGDALAKSAPLSSVTKVLPGASWQRLPAFFDAAFGVQVPGPARPGFLGVWFPSCFAPPRIEELRLEAGALLGGCWAPGPGPGASISSINVPPG